MRVVFLDPVLLVPVLLGELCFGVVGYTECNDGASKNTSETP